MPVLVAFVGLSTAACFSGVKYVGLNEPCVYGDQVFEGSARCREGFVCLLSGERSGHCAAACGAGRTCSEDLVCAAGACVSPCTEECGRTFAFSGICCELPAENIRACLPETACLRAGGNQDAGMDAVQPDGGIEP
jgi:hypothetical protein